METEIIELWHVRPDWQLPCTYEYGYEGSRLQAYSSLHPRAGRVRLADLLITWERQASISKSPQVRIPDGTFASIQVQGIP